VDVTFRIRLSPGTGERARVRGFTARELKAESRERAEGYGEYHA
jgi:hypothetical protein